jgi:hypothetical protein
MLMLNFLPSSSTVGNATGSSTFWTPRDAVKAIFECDYSFPDKEREKLFAIGQKWTEKTGMLL